MEEGILYTTQKNKAISLFIGEIGDEPQDLRQFDTWYSTDILTYLTHLPPASPDIFRYVYSRDRTNETQSYYKQLVALCYLSQALEKAVCFISTKSPTEQNHFIFGLILNQQLLIIDPVGMDRKKDFVACLRDIKTIAKLTRVYYSTVLIQKEKGNSGLFACGAICAELMQHFSQLPFKRLLTLFEQWQEANRSDIDIAELLPRSLKTALTLEDKAYREHIIAIRMKHLQQLEQLNGQTLMSIDQQNERLDLCLFCPEQAIMFDVPIINLKEKPEDIVYSLPSRLQEKYPTIWQKQQLFKAIQQGDIAIVTHLLHQAPLLITTLDSKGNTLLMKAIQGNQEIILRYLLQQGANRDAGTTLFPDAAEFARSLNKETFAKHIEENQKRKMGDYTIKKSGAPELTDNLELQEAIQQSLAYPPVKPSSATKLETQEQSELLNEIRRCYFEDALTKIKLMTQSLPAKPSVYLLGYENEPKATKRLCKRLYNDLSLIWGKDHIICPVYGSKLGEQRSLLTQRMRDCPTIVVLCTPALNKAYNQTQSDHLSNAQLSLLFTLFTKNTHRIIPFYIGDKDNIPFFIQDFVGTMSNHEDDYQTSFFALLRVMVNDSALNKAINEQEKLIKQQHKDSQQLPPQEQQSSAKTFRQQRAAEKQNKNQATCQQPAIISTKPTSLLPSDRIQNLVSSAKPNDSEKLDDPSFTNTVTHIDASYQAEKMQLEEQETNPSYPEQKASNFIAQARSIGKLFQAYHMKINYIFPSSPSKINNSRLPIDLWNFPKKLYSKEMYVERKLYEQRLDNILRNPSEEIARIWIYGGGGLGKTSLALNYMNRNKKQYTHRFWFNFGTLDNEYQKLNKILKLVGDVTKQELTESIVNWFSAQKNYLIVYDNVPDFEALIPYLPDNGHIIMTSRITARSAKNWQISKDKQILLSSMEQEKKEAHKLIKIISDSKDDINIKNLAEQLGYLPVALAQASAYLNIHRTTTIPEYLESYKSEKAKLLKKNNLTNEHKSVYATLQVNLAEIKSETAYKLLKYSACLYGKEIPLALMKYLLYGNNNISKKQKTEFNEAIDSLANYSIIDYQAESPIFSLHSLKQEVNYEEDYALSIIKMLGKSYEMKLFNQQITAINFIPHLIRLTELIETAIEKSKWIAIVNHIIQLYIVLTGFYIDSYQLDKATQSLAKTDKYFSEVKQGKEKELIKITRLYNQIKLKLLCGEHQKAQQLAAELMEIVNSEIQHNDIKLPYILIYSDSLRAVGKYNEAIKECEAVKNYFLDYKICCLLADIYYGMNEKDENYYKYYTKAIVNLDRLLEEKDLESTKKALNIEKARIFVKLGETMSGLKWQDNNKLYKVAKEYLDNALEIYKKYASTENERQIYRALILTHKVDVAFTFEIVRKITQTGDGLGFFSRLLKLPGLIYGIYFILIPGRKSLDEAFYIIEDVCKQTPKLILAKTAHITILNHYAIAFSTLAQTLPIPILRSFFLTKAFGYHKKITEILGLDPEEFKYIDPELSPEIKPKNTRSLYLLADNIRIKGPHVDLIYILRYLDNLGTFYIVKGKYKLAFQHYYQSFLLCNGRLGLTNRALKPICGIMLSFARQNIINKEIREIWRHVDPIARSVNLDGQFKKYYNKICRHIEGKISQKYEARNSFRKNFIVFALLLINFLAFSLPGKLIFTIISIFTSSYIFMNRNYLPITAAYFQVSKKNKKEVEVAELDELYKDFFSKVKTFLTKNLNISLKSSTHSKINTKLTKGSNNSNRTIFIIDATEKAKGEDTQVAWLKTADSEQHTLLPLENEERHEKLSIQN